MFNRTFAAELRKKGLKEGERVAIRLKSAKQFLEFFFGAFECGASVCPISLRLPEKGVKNALERLAPRLFIDEQGIHQLFPHPIKTPPSVFLFTSGSTGTPKIACLPLTALQKSAESAIEKLGLTSDDCWLLSLPLHHVGGLGIVFRVLAANATWTLNPEDPRITHISCVPTQLFRAKSFPPKLKCLLVGGAPLHHLKDMPPKVQKTYGLTEMSSMVTLDGRVLPGREVKISEDGEICVKGETLFAGYWEQGSGLFLPVDQEGWFPTKDLGAIDAGGKLLVLGRKDWMFISGGENIQPEEIEAHLAEIPEILGAVVMPKEDPEFGARPIAYVCSKDPTLSLEKVREKLGESLPRYKLPVELRIVDHLPRQKQLLDLLRN